MSAANHWTPKLFPQSLRWRLSAVIALVASVLAVALSLLVRTEFSRVQLADARRVQDERIQLVVRDYGLTGRAALGSRLDAPDVPRELLAAARGGRRATYLQRTANGAWIWAAAETDGHLLSLRSPYTDRDDALRQLDNALILGSAGVLVLASVLGVVLGARLSRRLRRAAVAARRVAEGDATLSVGEEIGTRPRDETAELAQAVDAVAAALRGRLAAEQRVTAAIAHEMRTPRSGCGTGLGCCARWWRTSRRWPVWTPRPSRRSWWRCHWVTSCPGGCRSRWSRRRRRSAPIPAGWSGCW